MTEIESIRNGVLNVILESLGMNSSDIEQCSESDGYRIEFEQNFTIELQHLNENECRVSARIFNLGKSLQVQELQLHKAISIFSELLDDLPAGISMAISDHDNCLRICVEIFSKKTDEIMTQFHEFVHTAFAYKQTYFKHK
jgi:hypothetical protein